MNNNKSYILYTRIVLLFIFLVILAGSVVRTTHSGMGCPDWPRCFGRWIPPLHAGQLPPDYEKYLSRQDIDHSFNAFHTWVEYINRLCSVLLSWAVIGLMVWSFKKFFRSKRIIFWLSVWLFIGLLVEAVLGYLVVHTNLHVDTVTLHLFPIFVLAGICVVIIHKAQGNYKINDTSLQLISTIVLVIAVIQVFLGTMVREQVDIAGKAMHYLQREKWLENVHRTLTVHEVCAWITAISCVYLFWRSLSYPKLQKMGFLLLLFVVAELAIGFILVKLDFPAFAQPLHLLFGSAIAITLYSYWLHFGKKNG